MSGGVHIINFLVFFSAKELQVVVGKHSFGSIPSVVRESHETHFTSANVPGTVRRSHKDLVWPEDSTWSGTPAENLLNDYSSRHRQCLRNPGSHTRYLVYKGTTFAGVGNVLPPVVTGFLLALMTDRIFFIDFPMFAAIFEHELDFNWTRHSEALLVNRPNVTTAHTFSGFEEKDLSLWLHGDLEMTFNYQDIVYYGPDMDSLSSVLVANLYYARFFEMHFPTREVFYPLSQFLFSLSPAVQKTVDNFQKERFGTFTIGLQIRKLKCGTDTMPCEHLPPIENFCSVAQAMQYAAGVSDEDVRFFVATDTNSSIAQVESILGPNRVVHTDYNMSILTEAGDPGTHEAAVVDMKLLSLCDDLIITSASSFGSVAAGWGNIKGVHMTFGDPKRHNHLNPHFWRALTSEPCFWGFSKFKQKSNADDVRTFLTNPYGLQHEQCHS